jgi:stringent starvation protein B
MDMTSNKPYLIRAIYDWIIDNSLTPYVVVNTDYPGVQVPWSYVKDAKIVLNIALQACKGLHIDNERIIFTARFSGNAEQVFFPPAAVLAIYAQENNCGMEFSIDDNVPASPMSAPKQGPRKNKPTLSLVKKQDD